LTEILAHFAVSTSVQLVARDDVGFIASPGISCSYQHNCMEQTSADCCVCLMSGQPVVMGAYALSQIWSINADLATAASEHFCFSAGAALQVHAVLVAAVSLFVGVS